MHVHLLQRLCNWICILLPCAWLGWYPFEKQVSRYIFCCVPQASMPMVHCSPWPTPSLTQKKMTIGCGLSSYCMTSFKCIFPRSLNPRHLPLYQILKRAFLRLLSMCFQAVYTVTACATCTTTCIRNLSIKCFENCSGRLHMSLRPKRLMRQLPKCKVFVQMQ